MGLELGLGPGWRDRVRVRGVGLRGKAWSGVEAHGEAQGELLALCGGAMVTLRSLR